MIELNKKTNKTKINYKFEILVPKNPLIDCHNINHFKTEIINLREICWKTSVVVLCAEETKAGSSFPAAQYLIGG